MSRRSRLYVRPLTQSQATMSRLGICDARLRESVCKSAFSCSLLEGRMHQFTNFIIQIPYSDKTGAETDR